MKFAKAMIIAGLLVAGAAYAETAATDANVIARQELMKGIGGAMKTLGGMAGGEMAYDAAAAEAAKAVLVANSAEIAAKFEMNAVDPATKAKPEAWANWDDFVAKATALNAAATAMDAASAEGIGAGMGDVGGACKACHMAYKM